MVYAIFKALDQDEKENFVDLLSKEDIKPKKRKYPKVYDNLPEKFHPENREILIAEIMHGK